MPIADYLRASGDLVHAGETGQIYLNVGKLAISTAAKRGVDANLWAILKIAVDHLTLSVNVNSIDTGKHSKNSRHYLGRAADINKISVMGDTTPDQAMMSNPKARELVEYLLAEGFHIGEGKPWAALLFGPPLSRFNPSKVDHTTHLHMSIAPRKKAA